MEVSAKFVHKYLIDRLKPSLELDSFDGFQLV